MKYSAKKAIYMKDYSQKNREKLKDYNKRRRAFNKMTVIEHYSKTKPVSCECCGESHVEFLTIDHIYGDGAKHKKLLKLGKGNSVGIYRDIIKKGFPEGYRVLCFNCNCSLGFLGYCPHGNVKKENRKEDAQWTLFSAFGTD